MYKRYVIFIVRTTGTNAHLYRKDWDTDRVDDNFSHLILLPNEADVLSGIGRDRPKRCSLRYMRRAVFHGSAPAS